MVRNLINKYMTKEIKFRAQRTDSKQFVEGYYVKILASQLGITDVILANARICHVIFDEYGVFWHIKLKTLGQLTGLKDKNGKEIFEGDILECNLEPLPPCYWEIFWGENTESGGSMWGWMARTSTGIYTFDNSIREQGKIIGNVYENPELLEALND